MYKIGVDVGGTFTDFTIYAEGSESVLYHKRPSTPRDPADAISMGVREIFARYGIAAKDVLHMGHGTTVATNLIIERRGAKTGLLVTRGFRDALEIARQTRPHLYDYSRRRPVPLVPRELRLEVSERLYADGSVFRPLAEAEVEEAAEAFRLAGAEAVAICFLHSYRNPEHERRAAEIVQRVLPEAYLSLSSDVMPEFREYERMSTTVLNAYAGPRMRRYLDHFIGRTRDAGINLEPYTIHSNGGLMAAETVRRFPVRTCLSGPAAGVMGAAAIASAAGFPDIITFDAGGTSTDVSLVLNATPRFTVNHEVAEYPVKAPMVDIRVIGAGGGSIARIDQAGAVKVGPESAGADPGPVAYGHGGTDPTITDAHLVLGRLDPEALLGGEMAVDRAAARAAIERRIGRPLGLSAEAAAEGIVRIANANIARAIRAISTERGYSLGDFSLFAFGGAGPLHAAELLRECQLARVLVPQEPGTLCARGILLTDVNLDFVRTRFLKFSEDTLSSLRLLFDEMREEAADWVRREGIPDQSIRYRHFLESRYRGQNHEVQVELSELDDRTLAGFPTLFSQAHRREYGYDVEGREIEVVNCRLQVIAAVSKAPLRPLSDVEGGLEDAVSAERSVYFNGQWHDTKVHKRSLLPISAVVRGPAIVEEMSSTIVILPGQQGTVDRFGNILIEEAEDSQE